MGGWGLGVSAPQAAEDPGPVPSAAHPVIQAVVWSPLFQHPPVTHTAREAPSCSVAQAGLKLVIPCLIFSDAA